MNGRVLICAGSDSGGGAGIQADIKTVTALGGFAATTITALTAQNTKGVFSVYDIPINFIKEQARVVLQDLGADCVKTGMLHNADVIKAVAETLETEVPGAPLVVDPVMVAKGGHQLLEPTALDILKSELIIKATLITPNVPEAELLSGMVIENVDSMRSAAEILLALGPRAVLIKGGHLAGESLTDLLVTESGERTYSGPRLDTRNTHGTGCTLASAIATGLAQKYELENAIERARNYVFNAILSAPGLGSGHGPLNHAHTMQAIVDN
ncbi:MAG: bifunctional hydroxymethylpyrimidine kinase/phosphomethylpyrimidine kinase [Rhodospirillaceae bacterium]|nr:bifunctional hydroxymethylpyrimidine kinase/phosphomethylpyrimidine kinase [Rhodospirillaceae bacterium]